MMLMGFHGPGLGDAPGSCGSGNVYVPAFASCEPNCPSGQCYDGTGLCVDQNLGTCNQIADTGSSNPGSTAQAWWQNALSAVTSGAVIGLKTSSTPSGTSPVVAPTTPWYQSTGGIIGILAVLGIGTYFVVKK